MTSSERIPHKKIKALMKEFGAERVEPKVIEIVEQLLVKVIREVTTESLKFTQHRNRKTISEKDIEIAVGSFKIN